MIIRINNIEQLSRAIQPILVDTADVMADKVYEVLRYYLNDYYTGWTPQMYQRTYVFLKSAIKVKAIPYKNGAKASVYIDYDSMNNYENVTGFQVATWANQGLHGGLSVSHKPHVWDDTIKGTIDNNSLLKMAVKYLRSRGIDVK